MMMDERSSVLVTGASTGLGLEIALHLAEGGRRVFASMRDLGRRALLDERAASRGVSIEVLELDVTRPDSVERAVAAVLERSGRIDALVNNAGVQLRGYFEDLTDAEIRSVFETNVFGTMAVTRAVLPHLRARGRGRIVVVGSVGGRIASPAMSAYCASKFALEGLCESLAIEGKLVGVDVVVIEPGIVKTDIWSRNRNEAAAVSAKESSYRDRFERLERFTRHIVENAPTSPREVARTVARALDAKSPRLRYVVGRRAALVLALQKLLPAEIFDRLYLRALERAASEA